jgi:hypothetical protein
LHCALHATALPIKVSMVHALASSQLLGQLAPSQVSPGSVVPLPHVLEQSLSVAWVHPAGQQPSPLAQLVRTWCEHDTLQLAELPVSESMVHASPSLQVTGQLPSQVSPLSTMLSPQNGEQSLSLAWLQPAGQQPSPLAQVTIGW